MLTKMAFAMNLKSMAARTALLAIMIQTPRMKTALARMRRLVTIAAATAY